MQQILLVVGKPKAAYYMQASQEYLKRLQGFGGCRLLAVRAEREDSHTSPAALLEQESNSLLAQILPGDEVWALEIKGQLWSSVQWAGALTKVRDRGCRRLLLVVGGQLGLGQGIQRRANQLLSLGPITLPHELATVVVLEQLYRSHTILAGLPYHRS